MIEFIFLLHQSILDCNVLICDCTNVASCVRRYAPSAQSSTDSLLSFCGLIFSHLSTSVGPKEPSPTATSNCFRAFSTSSHLSSRLCYNVIPVLNLIIGQNYVLYIIYIAPPFFFRVVLFWPSKSPPILMKVCHEFIVLSAVDLNNRFPMREVKVCKLFGPWQRHFL